MRAAPIATTVATDAAAAASQQPPPSSLARLESKTLNDELREKHRVMVHLLEQPSIFLQEQQRASLVDRRPSPFAAAAIDKAHDDDEDERDENERDENEAADDEQPLNLCVRDAQR